VLAVACAQLGLALTPENCSGSDASGTVGFALTLVVLPGVLVGIGCSLVPLSRAQGVAITLLFLPWAYVSGLVATFTSADSTTEAISWVILLSIPGLVLLARTAGRTRAWAASAAGYLTSLTAVVVGVFAFGMLFGRCWTFF
jgi:hypothetical protein